jgi:hypothetical protein
MGLIICPRHGEAGFCLRFSKKIIAAIRQDRPVMDDQLSLFNIVLVDDEDGEEMFTETYLLLKEEFSAMKLPEKVRADNESVYNDYYHSLPELSGVCAECFREYKRKHDIRMLGFH